MTDGGFLDVYLPERLQGYPWTSSPRFSTTITSVSNGSEHRNRNWKHPLHRFQAPESIRCHDDVEELRAHWWVMAGPFHSFAMRDPLDFASRPLKKANLAPAIFPTDVTLGVGDGVETQFQLKKTYQRAAFSFDRKITLPVVDSVVVALNALDPATANPALPGGPYTWEVDRETGLVTFDHPITTNVIVTAGFLFDVRARFEADDSFDQIVQAYQVDGFADLAFVEVRPCQSGDSET